MALNYIWIAFFLIAFVFALVKLIFLGDTEAFKLLVDGIFDSSKSSVMEIALPLAGAMTFWLGIMKVGEKAGAMQGSTPLMQWGKPDAGRHRWTRSGPGWRIGMAKAAAPKR